ncbi:hypothetical protein QTP88_009250 [Uroleucon formosanum]
MTGCNLVSTDPVNSGTFTVGIAVGSWDHDRYTRITRSSTLQCDWRGESMDGGISSEL